MAYDLGDAVNMKHAMRLASYMKHSPILQIGAESPIILRDGESTTVPVYYWGDGVLSAASDDPLLTVTVSGRNLTLTKAAGANPEATITVSVAGTTDYNADSAYIKVAKGHRYGFRIDENNSDPYTRVSYMYDAVGQTPAHMDYTRGVFDYGSWGNKWFVTENKPLMLRSDGTVDYYLDPDNYDLKLDGTPSDVANTSYDGNAMAQFPLCWLKMWEDGTYKYCVISDVEWDSDYKAYAHTRADGSIEDFFYWSMFGGSVSSSKIRSLSGQTPGINHTVSQAIKACQANGVKWHIHSWSQRTLIAALLVLMGKSTDTQTAFGNGLVTRDNAYASHSCGELKDKGQFFGYNSDTQYVKAFHIENLWGNMVDLMVGITNNHGRLYVKMTPEGNGYRASDVNGYTDTGITLPNFSDQYISGMRFSEYGIIMTARSGSGSTYYCDGGRMNTSYFGPVFVGGASYYSSSALSGVFCFRAIEDISETLTNFLICGLSCEMPAAA